MRVLLGRFGSPHGIKGWMKLISFTDPPENILEYLPWYIFKEGEETVVEKVRGKMQGQNLIVQLEQCQDRDLAKTYTNLEIYVYRTQLPPPGKDEYYWVDLIGLNVINKEQQCLGKVESVFATGANDVLVLKDIERRERYIPYIEDVIVQVDLENKQLLVDWDADF